MDPYYNPYIQLSSISSPIQQPNQPAVSTDLLPQLFPLSSNLLRSEGVVILSPSCDHLPDEGKMALEPTMPGQHPGATGLLRFGNDWIP